MKRVLVVLALSLMLLFSVWGEAFADDPGGGPYEGDHPWSGEDFGVEGRNRFSAVGGSSVGSSLTLLSILLYDYTCINEVYPILWGADNVKTAAPNVSAR